MEAMDIGVMCSSFPCGIRQDIASFDDGTLLSVVELYADAYSVSLYHQSGANADVGVGSVVRVAVAVRVDVPRVGRVVGVRRSEPPVGGEK